MAPAGGHQGDAKAAGQADSGAYSPEADEGGWHTAENAAVPQHSQAVGLLRRQ